MESQEEAEAGIPAHAKKRNKNHDKGEDGSKWCAIHKSHSHNTEDCRDNKKSNKNNKHYKNNSSNKNGHHGNKSWSRQSDENKKFTQAEVNALVAKEVKKAKSTWSSQQKKRKNDNDEANMIILDSDNESVNPNNKDTADLTQLQLKLNGVDLDNLDKMFGEDSKSNIE